MIYPYRVCTAAVTICVTRAENMSRYGNVDVYISVFSLFPYPGLNDIYTISNTVVSYLSSHLPQGIL